MNTESKKKSAKVFDDLVAAYALNLQTAEELNNKLAELANMNGEGDAARKRLHKVIKQELGRIIADMKPSKEV